MLSKIPETQKVVVITGAARGIGYSLALSLAARGYIVCATYKKIKSAQNFKKINKKFPNLYSYHIDVSDDKSVEAGIQKILAKHHRIDVLVNNAARLLFGPIETVSIQQLKEEYDTNVFGAVRMLHAILPFMRKNQSGHIIFMGTTSAVQCPPMYSAYASSKCAIEAIASSLASNLLFWNIKVSIIENSATNTQLTKKSLELGTRFRSDNNPYKKYVKSSLCFLRQIASNGQSPEAAAESIAKIIQTPTRPLRKFITKYAKNVFKEELKDPDGKSYLKIARKELKWFPNMKQKNVKGY